jgi:hypothetical protein
MLATAVSLAGAVGISHSAHAWTWDPHVHVAGAARCGPWWAAYSPSSVTIRLDNGSQASAGVRNYGSFGTYGLDFYSVPSGGIGATATVNCAMGTGNWSRRVTIYRPTVGSQQNLNLYQ